MTAEIASLVPNRRCALYAVGPETMAFDAMTQMDAHAIAMVLIAEGGKLLGVFSAEDYFNRLVLNGSNGMVTPVREVMTRAVATVRSSTTAAECMQIMTARGLRCLPIVDDGKLIGLVTRADLIKHQHTDQQSESDEVNLISASDQSSLDIPV